MKHWELKLPNSNAFLDMKNFLNKHGKEDVLIRSRGQISESTSKPSWIDPVSFKLRYKATKDDPEFYIEMIPLLSEESCKKKLVSL